MSSSKNTMLSSVWHDIRLSWRELALTDLVYKIIGFVLLTPLIGLLFRLFVSYSGRSVLADQDILSFFLSPIGWLALIVVGAVWIAVVALEQAALMMIVGAATQNQRISVTTALWLAAKNTRPTLLVTARIVVRTLLIAAPFLAAGGGVFLWLLTEYDINYYLAEKPTVFWVAGAIIAVILTMLVVLLVRMLTGWFFALPLLLFENVPTNQVLRTSRERVDGHRWRIAFWIAGWFITITAISVLSTAAVGLLARQILPLVASSLAVLVFAMGAMLVLWLVSNVIATLLTATTFAVLLVNLYRRLGAHQDLGDLASVLSGSTGARARFRLSRRLVLGVTSVAVLLAAIVGIAFLESVQLEDNTEITAHRGASVAAPENTMAAFERAVEEGADWIELDVQETSDGVVVVVHDSDLKKIAGVDLKIWDSTAEQLANVDIGSRFAPEFSAERVPTLDEVLRTFKGRIRVTIELKYYGHDQRLEERVVEIVEANDMVSDIVVMSLEADGIAKVKALRPKWTVGLLTAVAVGDLSRTDADFLAVNTKLATRRFVRSAHHAGKEVHAWTVNDAVMMSNMIGRGVDRLITDYPGRARSVLEQRANLSSLERLVLELTPIFGGTRERDMTIDDF